MKRTSTISIIIASIFIISCDRDRVATDSIGIPLLIQDISLSTKAIVNDRSLPDGSEIGLHVVDTDERTMLYSKSKSSSSNLKYTFTSSKWSYAESFTLKEKDGDVYAYYPYDTSGPTIGESSTTIPVVLGTGYDDDTDYMYYDPSSGSRVVSGKTDKNSIELPLKHALSKVTFKFYVTNYYPINQALDQQAKLTQFTIKDKDNTTWIKSSDLKMNIGTGEITGGVGTIIRSLARAVDNNSSDHFLITATTSDTSQSFTFLVCPFGNSSSGAASSDIIVTFTIDGRSYEVFIPENTDNTPIAWEAGKENTYTIKISSTSFRIDLIEVRDWIPNTIQVPGDITHQSIK